MKTKAWILTIASAALLACGGPAGTGFDTSGPGGNSSSGGSSSGGSGGSNGGSGGSGGSTSGGSGSGGSSGSGTSSGASGSGSSGGSGSSSGAHSDGGTPGINYGYTVPTADVGQTITLTALPFQVAAGAEVYKCQVFANPFGGVTTDIVKLHGKMSAGSHHFFLFNIGSGEAAVEPAVGTLGDCAGKGLEFHPFPFLGQSQDWTVTFPGDATGAPMAYSFIGQNYFMINVHYLNSGTQPIMANVSIDITTAKPGVVKTHVGTLFLNNTTLSVPGSVAMTSPVDPSMTWAGDPSLPATYNIFTSWQHMHHTALKFTATTNGQAFYTDTNWDSPNLFIHAPGMAEPSTATGTLSPIPMTNSQSITWDCQYYNPSATGLTFGDSAISNVMCIYLGQYYPASATAPDIVYVLN
jgi:hypothetical protein